MPPHPAHRALLTPDGEKAIEDFRIGDLVMSAPEDDREAPPQARKVAMIFRRFASLINLHVNGHVIRTTHEHPFWVEGQGWVEAWKLQSGDQEPVSHPAALGPKEAKGSERQGRRIKLHPNYS